MHTPLTNDVLQLIRERNKLGLVPLSIRAMAAAIGRPKSIDNVFRALKRLEAAGVIKITKAGRAKVRIDEVPPAADVLRPELRELVDRVASEWHVAPATVINEAVAAYLGASDTPELFGVADV